MVCSKCQKKLQSTELATPGVKRKNDMYYGSPSSSLGGGDKGKAKPTLGATGIGKVCYLSYLHLIKQNEVLFVLNVLSFSCLRQID
jgi:hypothetical protein